MDGDIYIFTKVKLEIFSRDFEDWNFLFVTDVEIAFPVVLFKLFKLFKYQD